MVLYQYGESVIEVVRYMEISVPGASWRRGVDRWSETVGGDVAEGQDETTAPIFTMDRSLRARRVTVDTLVCHTERPRRVTAARRRLLLSVFSLSLSLSTAGVALHRNTQHAVR